MAFEFYRILHLLGIFLVLLSLGGISLHAMNGGTRDFANRKLMAMVHGIGLLLALISGFGLLGKASLGFPGWAGIKLLIWLSLGGAPTLLYRKKQAAKGLFFLIFLLAGLGAYLAIGKPF